MVDITHKNTTLRIAVASATVTVSSEATIKAIKEGCVPKGDVFEMSKAAGLLGVKKTPELLPDCHPIPIEYTGFSFEINGLQIQIQCEVKTIYKTGVEVEAMHGASIAALNMYDMLKPLDKQVEIGSIKLLSKKGGKSDLKTTTNGLKAGVVICSDSVSAKKAEDRTGMAIQKRLIGLGLECEGIKVVPDDKEAITSQLVALANAECNLIVFSGGTGAAPRDVTFEALNPLIEKRLLGVEEAMRSYGQARTPVAMFSRSLAGIYKQSIVLALPGSTAGATDSLNAVLPTLLHLIEVIQGKRHD
ncbi:MAG: bifunctional molybdenum cofactor biosynthesis protein MoaC/MoaB [Flavobacteriaceae bacterium]